MNKLIFQSISNIENICLPVINKTNLSAKEYQHEANVIAYVLRRGKSGGKLGTGWLFYVLEQYLFSRKVL